MIVRVPHGVQTRMLNLMERFCSYIERGEYEHARDVANEHRFLVEAELRKLEPKKPKKTRSKKLPEKQVENHSSSPETPTLTLEGVTTPNEDGADQ